MEMIDIKNKKLRDDEFYKIRKEVHCYLGNR